MLDVHPPHEAAHSWKDFFIHIATIVIGLLIAIGLEQTVEAVHHRHKRQQLEAGLEVDSKVNAVWARDDMTAAQSVMDWALQQAEAVRQAGPQGPLLLQRMTNVSISVPNTGIWQAAKANGEVGLLPEAEQNWLADLDRVESQTFTSDSGSAAHLRAGYAALDQALRGRYVPSPSGDLDISAMGISERNDVEQQLRAIAEEARDFESRLVVYSSYNQFIFATPTKDLAAGSEERFARIAHDIVAAHPATRYTFSAK